VRELSLNDDDDDDEEEEEEEEECGRSFVVFSRCAPTNSGFWVRSLRIS
jgi:hypothetical protein